MSAPTTMQWIRQAAQRIATGSTRLTTHLASRAVHAGRRVWRSATGWLGEASGVGWLLRLAMLLAAAAVLRKITTAVAVGLYARVASGGAPWLLWGTAGVWVIAAYRCGRDGWEPKQAAPEAPADAKSEDQEDEEKTPEAAPASAPQAAAPLSVSPVALVAAVRDIGTPHAQLTPLAEHLGTTTDVVRATAAGMGWQVKDVRMQGRSASAGLRWDEVPSPPPATPAPGVVGAGQLADDNDDDTDGEGPGEGIRARRTNGGLVIYDLTDAHRHYRVNGQ
ncbi:hypothetical protein ACIO02_34035 [Streptomyces sp. NPDC087568]|uniref:hypothetical protein n=1 Tax=unclassified Streptomyces TaxID=2593676 RepID=UPI0036E968E1